ncbi:MAG TPA: DUF6768 family protein [Sphingomicrobium sp.]|nr:DUF6768 family protein [Sphingomicrobium sp.]
MSDVDRMIDEALDAEERELLRSIGDEPGFVERMLGMTGPEIIWMVWVMMIVQTLLFVGGLYAAWMFFEAGEPVTQLRWGLPAVVLLLMALIIKLAVPPAVQTKRLMRELKRIELQIVRMSKE